MNIEHKDIDKFIPFGEALRGFANQKFISAYELQTILKERGVFVLNADKDYLVPILQTLMLSPSECIFSQRRLRKENLTRDIISG